jgi:membrane fusion protein (multidrug efflux system)
MRSRKALLWRRTGIRQVAPPETRESPMLSVVASQPASVAAPCARIIVVDNRIARAAAKSPLGKTLLGLGSFESDRSAVASAPSMRAEATPDRATAQPTSEPARARSDDTPPVSDMPGASAHNPGRRRLYRGGALLALVAGAGIAFVGYQRANASEDTDDAQVDAQITSVSSRVVGTVSAIHAHAHQPVRAGDLLAELDPIDLELAVSAATANLARADAALQADQPSLAIAEAGDAAAQTAAQAELESAQAALAGAQRDVKRLHAQLAEAEAQAQLAVSERQRSVALAESGALSQAAQDARLRTADATRANADAMRESIAATRARLTQRTADIAAARAHVTELRENAPRRLESRRAALAGTQANRVLAKAQLEQAQTQLSYAKVYAPVSGVIGAKVAGVGESVAPGQQLFAICQTDDLWVTANFRENQLQHMRPGQRARVYVDAIDREFDGHVESIAGATGSRFSLLPPENASGNYVKVVQRIPVKIRLEPGQPGLARLRAGMSVEPSVRIR